MNFFGGSFFSVFDKNMYEEYEENPKKRHLLAYISFSL